MVFWQGGSKVLLVKLRSHVLMSLAKTQAQSSKTFAVGQFLGD